jgi:hypothetical protein
MIITTFRTTTWTMVLGLGLASACGGDDADDDVGDELNDGTADDTSSDTGEGDTDSGTDESDTDTDSDTGDDPNGACVAGWDVTTKKASGQIHAGYGVAIADDGKFVVVGKLENADDDAWIAMFDPSGEVLWEDVVDSGQGKDYGQSVTFDAAGDVVFVGSLSGTNKDLWIEKRSAAAGAIAWTVIEPSNFDGDNLPGDIALAPDGALIVSATVRAGDQDSDLEVRKLATATGVASWTTSFSGVADPNGFSIDRAGPVAVAADGSIYVGVEEGVDAQTKEGALLKFGADGGAEQWRLAPQEDGSDHLHEVVAVVGGPESEAYFVVYEASDASFWLYRAAADASIDWVLDREAFEFNETSGWVVTSLDIADEGSLTIGGRLTKEENAQALAWSEAWVANIRLDGAGECLSTHTWENPQIIPASTYAYALAEGPNGVVAVGEIINGPENYLWVGGFD